MATDEPTELLPCAICARTFKPLSLEKHTRICELAAIKKRKPFDSAKQRIQGTELAEFLPKETIKRKNYQPEEKIVSGTSNKGSWKQTHDEFLRAIREARGETIKVTPQRQLVAPNNVTVVGVPTRPNEKGMCPTCNRQFSIKSYERHVAWCKERETRVPMSAATNIAKERLEARMKYRVPALKNRRATNREKYSPLSAMNLTSLTSKNNNGNLTNQRAKETASTPSCNNNRGAGNENSTGSSQSQKSTVDTRRSGQSREGISLGPMKSRLSDRSSRISDRDSRAVWSNYVHRRPDFNFVLTGRTRSCADYDPFLIAERQMNDLLSDTCSEKSLTDTSSNRRKSSSPSLPNYPLSHSSAFVKYPEPVTTKNPKLTDKRVSLIAPPTEFDDFSSDSTETNSILREINAVYDSSSRSRENNFLENSSDRREKNLTRDHVLGRRVIIDKSRALGTNETYDNTATILSGFENSPINGKVRNFFENTTPNVTRSNSVRLVNGKKLTDRKSNSSGALSSGKFNAIVKNRKNNCTSLSGSNVSLSSIMSSETDVKRTNSLFDELGSSYDDDASGIYPSLSSLLKNNSLSVDSPGQTNHTRNGQISDEEFSSPDSYKRQQQEHNKLSADSAYSSLNRKYSNHGRSTNDMAGRHDEDSPLRRRDVEAMARSKMSKFCHECGSKFTETAKFCCECGIRRLAL